MQTAKQIWDEGVKNYKNCTSWAQYEYPGTGSPTAVLCNGGEYRSSKGGIYYYDPCPSRMMCRDATRAKESKDDRRYLPLYQSSNENKLRPDPVNGAVHVPSNQVPNKTVSSGVITPQMILGEAQATPPAPTPAPTPEPARAPTTTVIASTPSASVDWSRGSSAALAEAQVRLAAATARLASPGTPVAQANAKPGQSPYKYSGVTPDPRVHTTPVVPPSTHPVGMQSPFAQDPSFYNPVPVFVPTHVDDIGPRLLLNILQSMLASAGLSIFSYARAVDLFAGLFHKE